MTATMDRNYDAIIAFRDLDGDEHRIDINPFMVPIAGGGDVFTAMRLEAEFMLMVPKAVSDEELHWYGQIAKEIMEKRLQMRGATTAS